ncbi:hypothetical protein UCRPC4_g06545 [Phaeomoniella chlamydospora]|uniref:Uncharacterized protein n=1 Tax=Phaeomoniella chlamydospora TaxID=158046 RepID=A0A0G2FST9_PHACM|nr:hypothetical protein UCRPC4_g06545 [Phaeomoniella chlamydospora]
MSGGKTAKTKKSSVEQISDRLLDLAARVAERQLREQALAAFPNERSYHPVDHYALEGEEEEEETRPGILSPQGDVSVSRFRRDSAADLDLELLKMRQHHNNLEKIEEEVKKRTLGIGDSKFSAAALAAKKGISLDKRSEDPVKVVGQWQKGAGLAQMRNAASPPMLGGDIKFPFSVSPKMTRCDVDQAPVPRRQDSDGDVEMDEQQLWSAKINVENDKDAGLWMGTCANSHSGTPVHDIRRSGLMTPSVEIDDPFNSLQNKERSSLFMQQLPLRPSASRPNPSADSINQMLQVEKEIEKEFNDAFVTQIYNYLSLGYPSLAHPFDEELSKISRMSIEELRKDDLRTDAKGYVGAPEGRGLEAADVAEGKCARWTALKLYIREWARQHPNMSERYPQEWGARARRGSWAI